MAKGIPCKWKQKAVVILTSDQINLKKYYKRQKVHYIMIKGSLQEGIITVKTHVPDTGART